MPEYDVPQWILFGCYHGEPAAIWSLLFSFILLFHLVCGHLPFHTECQHLIRWCLSVEHADRPSLQDIFEHSWLQDHYLAHETAEINPSAQ